MTSLLRKFRDSKYSTPLLLVVVTLLSYGLFAAQQGFHWDDWGFVWMARYGGNERLFQYFSVARPVLAYLYMVTLNLIGPNPLAWQVFALFWRAAAAVAMWWALRQVFVASPVIASREAAASSPKGKQSAHNEGLAPAPSGERRLVTTESKKKSAFFRQIREIRVPHSLLPATTQQIFWVTLLTLLYPGFSQHSIAIAYGHYSLLFTAFWLSIGLMVVAVRAEKRKWLPLSAALLLSAWSLFSAEYAFGLELLRPFFLCFALAETDQGKAIRERIKRTAAIYLPYLLVLVSFIVWRVFIFGFHMYQAELFDSSEAGAPLALSALPRTVADALVTSAGRAWLTLLDFAPLQDFSSRLLLITLVIVIGAFIFLLFFDSRFNGTLTSADREAHGEKKGFSASSASIRVYPRPAWLWILLGLVALLTAGIPFYVAGLDIKLGFPNDRFLMSFAFGASSLLVGMIGLLPKRDYRAVALSLLVALSMGKQVQYAHAFREDWETQKSFFWQLTWRAPQLEPNTVLLSDDSAIRFSVDYSLAGPLNWIYHPDNPQGSVDYAYYFISTRLGGPLSALKPGLPIEQDMHLAVFQSSTDDALVLQFRPPACLHLLDPRYDSDIPAPPNSIDITRDLLADGVPVLTARTLQALPISNVARIIPDGKAGATPPAFLFGTEPAHTWCYYFQKADLARQQADWSRVAALGDEAFAIPYYPNDASEFLPFIEAYLRLGRIDDARELTRSAQKQMPFIAPALCGVWQRVQAETDNSISASQMDKVIRDLNYCPSTQE